MAQPSRYTGSMDQHNGANKKRIDILVKKILYHQNKYYNAEPEISDAAFDILWDELRNSAPEHPVLHGIGRDASAMYAKREHRMVLHSQDKVSSEEAFTAWAKKSKLDSFLVQYKLDGISFELQYDAGRLVAGVSRGDGWVGDDLTHNAIRIPEIPFNVDRRFTGAVRGEIIMHRDVHREYFPNLANARNTTSGIMKRKDGLGTQHVRLLCYDARSSIARPVFLNELEKLEWLREQGFTVVETLHKDSIQEVLSYREHIIKQRSTIPYDIDGLVIKGVEIDEKDSAKNRPEKQVAFKFDIDQAQSVLESIEWSKNGHRLSPVAIFQPVQLHGTRVKRASLVNLQSISDLEIALGSEILISKRGEIIPKIESTLSTPENACLPLPPYRCADCNKRLRWSNTEISCTNPHCLSRAYHRVIKWIQVLGLEGFGKKRVEQLFKLGLVRDIPDLYTLQKEKLLRIERFGEQLAENLLSELQKKSYIDLARCIAGFDIAGVGLLTAQMIVESGYTTLEALELVDYDELYAIHGVGTVLADTFGTELKLHLPAIKHLVTSGAIHITTQNETVQASPVVGKSFCFTGTLHTMTRKEASDRVVALGGIVKTSVGEKLDYLVLESLDSQSSKAKRAHQLGITLLDESKFLALISY